MKRIPFLSGRRDTMIAMLAAPETPADMIGLCRKADFDGADAIAFDLSQLRPEYRNGGSFRQVMDCTSLPFMFVFYRNDKYKLDDEARQEILLTAAETGASMIDVMGDLYDPSPDENTHNPDAVVRQKQLIEKIHRFGAQVVMSSHPLRFMTSDEIIAQLKTFEERGADLVKIVTKPETEEEFLETLRGTMRANHELHVPFIHISNGPFARAHRFFGLSLGCAVTFAVADSMMQPSAPQPPVKTFFNIRKEFRWNLADIE